MQIKLTQDKIVKHSVRYATDDVDLTMSVYVPKELILRMQMEGQKGEMLNGYPKVIWMNVSLEEPSEIPY